MLSAFYPITRSSNSIPQIMWKCKERKRIIGKVKTWQVVDCLKTMDQPVYLTESIKQEWFFFFWFAVNYTDSVAGSIHWLICPLVCPRVSVKRIELKCFVRTTKKVLLHTFISQCEVNWFNWFGQVYQGRVPGKFKAQPWNRRLRVFFSRRPM